MFIEAAIPGKITRSQHSWKSGDREALRCSCLGRPHDKPADLALHEASTKPKFRTDKLKLIWIAALGLAVSNLGSASETDDHFDQNETSRIRYALAVSGV